MRANLSPVFAAVAVALLLSTAPAFAEVLNFSADLSGAAEVPPNDSPGTGQVSADYDTETKLFKWNISYQGLTGPATAAHFHAPANPDEVADPVIPVELEPAAAGAEPAAPGEAEPPAFEPAEPPAAEAPAEAEPEAPAEPAAEPAAPAEAQPGTPTEPATQLTGEATLTDEQAADLLAGRWYFNVHTAMYPDGELRGQLPPEED